MEIGSLAPAMNFQSSLGPTEANPEGFRFEPLNVSHSGDAEDPVNF